MEKKVFEKSQWIWINSKNNIDEYGEFFIDYCHKNGKVKCNISVDGDYTLFVNDKYVSSNQYGDFEHYKIYDTIDLTDFLKEGNNKIKFLVWHFGVDTSRYKNYNPGLIFEILRDDKVEIVSNKDVLCCKSPCFKSGNNKLITSQLGFSFCYDSTKENDYNLKNSVIVTKNCIFYKRPTKKLSIGKRCKSKVLKNSGNYFLVDLKSEKFGLPTLEFSSEKEQKITFCWGEDLQDNHVRRIIESRDFSFTYIAKKGYNNFTNYMLRLGLRYIEIFAESEIKPVYFGIYPQYYNVKASRAYFENENHKKIYDVCLRTLKNCMCEHYMDTPWREQSLYAFDGRNQMLCGYFAFKNGNFKYVKSNLKLMAEDRRENGLLSICYPSGSDLTIPSFSLYYIVAVKEYLEFSGDKKFVNGIFNKMQAIINEFINNTKNNLICRFSGQSNWNFYDWSKYLEGDLGGSEEKEPDFMINALFVYAMENFKFICQKLDRKFNYEKEVEDIKENCKKYFYNKDKNSYSLSCGKDDYCDLCNAFAILSEIASTEESRVIAEKIVNKKYSECSLSMKVFKYDALLKVDEEKYKNYVIKEIERDYLYMIENGATSVWETIDGAKAFNNAGSLCHGWSAIPIYFFNKLKLLKKQR